MKNIILPLTKIIVITIIIIFILLRFIGPAGIFIKEYSIVDKELPNTFNGLKIVHFSDIHYGTSINNNKLNKIVEEINKLNADIVIYTGDLFDKSINLSEESKKEIKESLKNINATIGKYAIKGCQDDDSFESIIEDSDFIYLDDESKTIYYNGNIPIEILGYNKFNTKLDISNNYKIALIHSPDNFDLIKYNNINIVFAGHSLGGQIRIPYYGSIIKNEGYYKYSNDFYEEDNTKMYISYGLGTNHLKIRLFNHPSINLYRFYTN